MARISLVIGQSHSLKEKRMVLRRIKDRARERVGVVVNEVGEHDIWQRAELGCAVASGDRGKALELLDDVVRVIVASGGADVVAIARDVQRFDAAPTPYTPVDDRTGAGDKAAAAADADGWVPEAWRDDLDEDGKVKS
ncbi:MAG: DUF503 domain-containing protein [Deltaproteobacteria bacterium]|nr:DUF503 domain-containing protein [Deltaproteobacteria bacterium]